MSFVIYILHFVFWNVKVKLGGGIEAIDCMYMWKGLARHIRLMYTIGEF